MPQHVVCQVWYKWKILNFPKLKLHCNEHFIKKTICRYRINHNSKIKFSSLSGYEEEQWVFIPRRQKTTAIIERMSVNFFFLFFFKTNFSEGSLKKVWEADLFCIFPCCLLQSPDMHLICTCATPAFRHPHTPSLPLHTHAHTHSRQIHFDIRFHPIMMTLLFY